MAMLTDNLRGALLMMGSMSAFTINDAFMKTVAADLPLMQSIFLRGVIVVPLMLILCRAMGQLRFDISRRDWHLILLRTSTLAALVAAAGVMLMAAMGLAFETWQPVATSHVGLLIGAAVFIIGG